MLFDDVQIAQVIVDRDAGVVDQDVEGVDCLDRPLDLRTRWSRRASAP